MGVLSRRLKERILDSDLRGEVREVSEIEATCNRQIYIWKSYESGEVGLIYCSENQDNIPI